MIGPCARALKWGHIELSLLFPFSITSESRVFGMFFATFLEMEVGLLGKII